MTRPLFHFTATSGWINDPHGITFVDGRYHLFYQYVPGSMVWAPNCHWGHAVGSDLFEWTELPIAIAPGDGDDGIWTGSLVQDGDETTVFYTSVEQPNIGIGKVRKAYPVDADWREWTKGDVVATAPTELEVIAYRDPFVFRDGEGWKMFIGAGLPDGTATALSYSSSDLDNWAFDGIAAQRSTNETLPVWTGALWECPQLFEIDGRHVMVTSVWDDDVLHYVAYGIGSYAKGVFEAETWGRLSYGPSYYAPSFFRDADGLPSLTFWLRGIADSVDQWASAHSAPHTLRLDGNTLVAAPHKNLDAYRAAPNGKTVEGLAADVQWTPSKNDVLTVRSGDSDLCTISVGGDTLLIRSGREQSEMPYNGGPLRLLLDGPSIELSGLSGVIAVSLDPSGQNLEFEAAGDLIIWALVR